MNIPNSLTSDRRYPCPRCGSDRLGLEIACQACLWTPKPATPLSAQRHYVFADRHVPACEMTEAIRYFCHYAFPFSFLVCLGSIAQIARGNPFEVIQGVITFLISGAIFLSLLRLSVRDLQL